MILSLYDICKIHGNDGVPNAVPLPFRLALALSKTVMICSMFKVASHRGERKRALAQLLAYAEESSWYRTRSHSVWVCVCLLCQSRRSRVPIRSGQTPPRALYPRSSRYAVDMTAHETADHRVRWDGMWSEHGPVDRWGCFAGESWLIGYCKLIAYLQK